MAGGLSDEAREQVMGFYRKVEAAQKKDGECEGIQGFASKCVEHAIRLAGIMEIYAGDGAERITAEVMSNALGLIDWYLYEVRRLLDSAPIRDLLQKAQTLLDWPSQPCAVFRKDAAR